MYKQGRCYEEIAIARGCGLVKYVYIHVLDCQMFLPHPAGGEAASRVGPKIALDHVRVYKKKKNYVCALWASSPLVVYDAIDNASSSRATRTEK